MYTKTVVLCLLIAGLPGNLLAQNGRSENRPTSATGNRVQGSPVSRVPQIATWGIRKNGVDKAQEYTSLDALVALRNFGSTIDITTDEAHTTIREAAKDAAGKGLKLIADLDVRMALPAFKAKYPDELQEKLILRDADLAGPNTGRMTIIRPVFSDHYQKKYEGVQGAFVRAFAYNLTDSGLIDPTSVQDITKQVTVQTAVADSVVLGLPTGGKTGRAHATVMVSFTYRYPDIFGPHLMAFQTELIQQYADVPLAGAHDDEFGFPPNYNEEAIRTEFWYSKNRASAYAERTGGRDLTADLLLMYKGIAGQESDRIRAVNHFMQMALLRVSALEANFYKSVKQTFGDSAIVGVHPTWFPFPERREFMKNGLDWWLVKRDWAQTDEVTPFAVRTALSKKWKSPVWYNMYYRYFQPAGPIRGEDYEQELWSSVLAGGRSNNLPTILGLEGVLASNYMQAENRIRLLNHLNPAPLDCPVAVVFGYAAATNWAGSSYEDVGMKVVDSLWAAGIATDLIPSYEIDNQSLTVDEAGYVTYGNQRYRAVVLYNPEFENESTRAFFSRVNPRHTRLFRYGDWTRNFDGKPYNGTSLLPKSMQPFTSIPSLLEAIGTGLTQENVARQSPATRILEGFGHTSLAPPTTGHSWLLDGTLVQTAATQSGAGDPLISRMHIGPFEVRFDAIGLAAVRLDEKGQVLALAAGGLKSFRSGAFTIDLPQRVDCALWRDEQGGWAGVYQGQADEVPAALLKITRNWTRLAVPKVFDAFTFNSPQQVRLTDYQQKNPSSAEEAGRMLTDIDGNTYRTAEIGSQTWMTENLRVKRYNDGRPLDRLTSDNGAWQSANKRGSYTWFNNDSLTYEATHGKLYNWQTATANRVCPVGWHVPSDADWLELFAVLGAKKNGVSPNEARPDGPAFNPMAGGYRHPYGTYGGMDDYGVWWSATGLPSRVLWAKSQKTLYLYQKERNVPATFGFSIRCLKD